MPRRRVLTVKKIYEERGIQWARHYKNRNTVIALCRAGWSGREVAIALKQDYPAPSLQIDASIPDLPLFTRREYERGMLSRFRLTDNDLLCLWYWTVDDWQDFIHAYQTLPEVYEDYYYKYDRVGDRCLLVPMSSKPKQGSALVDNLAEKGTSVFLRREKQSVPVDRNRYNSAQKGTSSVVLVNL